jgi:hypothetical protein
MAVLIFACAKKAEETPPTPPPASPSEQPKPPVKPPPDICDEEEAPGRVTLHRLNRSEYNRTVRDLINDRSAPADGFPSDDHGYGFDNNANVLSMSPLLFEKYDIAAGNLVEAAIQAPPAADSIRAEAELLEGTVGRAGATSWNLWSNGELTFSHDFVHDGRYKLSARAWQSRAGTDNARMEIIFDTQVLETVNVMGESANPQVFETEVQVSAGNHQFKVGFINDYYMPDDPDPNNRDRNLYVDWLNIEGPLDVDPNSNPTRIQIVSCQPSDSSWEQCAAEIVSAFGLRAWRRPLTSAEVQRLVALSKIAESEGDNFDTGLGLAMHAVLLSPHFIFRVELDESPGQATAHALTDFELAARLSYFLWSSTPDSTLLALAQSGELSKPEQIAIQVKRMLQDPRSDALTHNFAGQWLYTRALDDVNPDYAVFPDFDLELLAAMRDESNAVFEEFARSDRSFLEILDADFTFLNDRLAQHYGLAAVESATVTRVRLPEGNSRRGLLSQAGLLTVTSYPKRTSAVRRGKWLLEQLLCAPPPPPPPGVEGLIEEDMSSATLRETLEKHRADPTCASCHITMDALGFALEQFDGIGAFRLEDRSGFPIDASGALPDGRQFDGATELSEMIKADKNFPKCVAERLTTYALGRGLYDEDECKLRNIVESTAAAGGSFESVAISIVTNPIFTQRQGEAAE